MISLVIPWKFIDIPAITGIEWGPLSPSRSGGAVVRRSSMPHHWGTREKCKGERRREGWGEEGAKRVNE